MYRSQYMPRYVPPEERDFCSYFDQLKYEETLKNPDNYFRNVKVINFDIINHECRGNPLEKDLKEHFAIQNKDSKISKDGQKNSNWWCVEESK